MAAFLKKIIGMTKDEFIDWLHESQGSLGNYLLKIGLAVLIYFIISDSLTSIIRKILHEDEDPRYRRVNKSSRALVVILYIFKYVVLIIVLYDIIHQLNIVETSPSVTLLVSTGVVLLLLLTGAMARGIKKLAHYLNRIARGEDIEYTDIQDIKKRRLPGLSKYSETRRTTFRILSFLYKLVGIAIGVALALVACRGISYVLETKGTDISHLLALPEYQISREFQTEFNWDKDLPDQLPISLGEHVNAKTNGDINLIYVDGTYVAINTSSRDYRFYEVGINQSIRSSLSQTTFRYENSSKLTQTTRGKYSDSYIYCNWENNNCLVLTVNNTSNRVASLTYIRDLRAVANYLGVNED